MLSIASNKLHSDPVADDRARVAATILLEAAGEGEQGMLAVANVIQNRCRFYNQSAVTVVTTRDQFSCWSLGLSDSLRRARAIAGLKEIHYANDLAAQIGTLEDNTGGAIYFCNPWISGQKNCAHRNATRRIGNHLFYR